jgi:hypothetical protein
LIILKWTLALLLGNEQEAGINAISLLAFGLSILFVIFLWSGRWQPGDPNFELPMAITTLLGMLFSPHVNPQDGLLIVMPALLFYIYLRENAYFKRVYAVFVLLCPLVFLLWEFSIGSELGIRAPVIGMLVLIFWMLRALQIQNKQIRSKIKYSN